jgi:hypothetical protein
MPAASARAKKSNTPMIAGIAAVLVLAVGGGGYFAMQRDTTETASVAPQGDTTQRLSQPVTALPQTVNLPRELEQIRPLVDSEAVAAAALDRLQRLDSLARTADDSTLLQFRYMRSKALITLGQEKAGCDSLISIEGKLNQSQMLKRAARVLLDACAQR